MTKPAINVEQDRDKLYRNTAVKFLSDDELEIDDDALVSKSDGGAWVQAWVWISRADVEI